MDYLWSPWRYTYISKSEPDTGCIFCVEASEDRDEEHLIVYRGRLNFVLLNLFPYTSGHLMVAPYKHVATLSDAGDEVLSELIQIARMSEGILRDVYRPEGFNMGFNIGKCAGAGVPGHIHMHIVPRWMGDANFMTTVGETRVIPEAIQTTYARLKPAFPP